MGLNRYRKNEIIQEIDQEIGEIGFRCVEVEWAAHERAFRIFIDFKHPNGETVQVEQCAEVSRKLDEVSSSDTWISGPYQLEVSSPGIERPLRSESDFASQIGETVRMKLEEKVADRRNGVGKVIRVESNQVTILTEGGEWQVPLEKLSKANLVVDWTKQSNHQMERN